MLWGTPGRRKGSDHLFKDMWNNSELAGGRERGEGKWRRMVDKITVESHTNETEEVSKVSLFYYM